jgi:type IV secretion system protein VirB9
MIIPRLLIAAALAVCAVSAGAKTKPVPSGADPRLQRAPYVHDVIEIVVRPGRYAEIELSPGETDIRFGIGDRDAWIIKTAGNTFAFKPKAKFADTNLKIWSANSNRVYWFNIVMAGKDDQDMWHLSFDYPPEPPKPAPAPTPVVQSPEVVAIQLAQREKEDIERSLGGGEAVHPYDVADPAPAQPLNGNYGIMGPEELTPTSVYDNGEQTVLTFAPNHPMPTIFVKEADGSETRVSKHFENDMLIVHRVAKQFVLRHMGQAACLINGSFNPTGPNNRTKTISNNVIRETIKGN